MIDKQQTDKLWNWCGFEYHWYPSVYGGVSKRCGWYLNGKFRCTDKPRKNLDNLYRYAVPKSQEKGYFIKLTSYDNDGFYGETGFRVKVKHPNYGGILFDESADSPTEVLLNTIMKVIEVEETE